MTTVNTSGRVLGLGAVAMMIGLLQPPDAAAQQGEQVRKGARLYGHTCARCHNPRPATERTDREWSTIMGHMRTRANLSKSDAQAILAFLQATNGSPDEDGGRTSSSDATGQAGDEETTVPSLVLALSDTESNGFPLLRVLYPSVWSVWPAGSEPAAEELSIGQETIKP